MPICRKSFYASLSTTSPSPINPKITPSIFMANHSPPSSGNHRLLFVKPAKRGKQRAGGEALFPSHHFIFHYPQHHHLQLTPKQLPPFQRVTTPLPLRGGTGGEALYALHYLTFNYQARHPHNYFTTQLGTSCSFDSPGLARNEPTPGKHPQADSTPSVLSFF